MLVDVVDRRRLRLGVDLAPGELRLIVALPGTVMGVGVATEILVIRRELVDLRIPTRPPDSFDLVHHQVLVGAGSGGHARLVGRSEWLARDEVPTAGSNRLHGAMLPGNGLRSQLLPSWRVVNGS